MNVQLSKAFKISQYQLLLCKCRMWLCRSWGNIVKVDSLSRQYGKNQVSKYNLKKYLQQYIIHFLKLISGQVFCLLNFNSLTYLQLISQLDRKTKKTKAHIISLIHVRLWIQISLSSDADASHWCGTHRFLKNLMSM